MVGQTVSHFQILERLGAGGMGTVYRAEDTILKRQVALKFLPKDASFLPRAKERFMHEARTASALDHPNICTIHEIAETDKGQLFLVMSCYEGETLRARLHRRSLSIEESVGIATQLCDGLGAAHAKDIVHRDLKPDNIMILLNGLVKILDFGLAKFLSQSKITTQGTTLGTTAYMSPEQVQSLEMDRRSDIYSLSVILYEMLTGRLPFKGGHRLATLYLIVNASAPSLQSLNPRVPKRLERIVLTGMHRDRERRYQSCSAMREDLLSIVNPGVPGAVPHAREVPAHQKPAASGYTDRARGPFHKRAVLYGALGLVILAVIAIVLFLFENAH